MRRRYAFDEAEEVAKILGDLSPTYPGRTYKEGNHAFTFDEWKAQWKVKGRNVQTIIDGNSYYGLVGQLAVTELGDDLMRFANKYNLAISAEESSKATGTFLDRDTGARLLDSFVSEFEIGFYSISPDERFNLVFHIEGTWVVEWYQGGKSSCKGSVWAETSFKSADRDGNGYLGEYEIGGDEIHNFNNTSGHAQSITLESFIPAMEQFIAQAKVEYSKIYAVKEAKIKEQLRKVQAEKTELLSQL
tara:strand:- start:437 stop:1174 length:738 start_codon:yes stop_codon:yes gene_type:complete